AMARAGAQGSSQHAGEQARREQATGHRSQTEPSRGGSIVTTVTEKAQDLASGAKETVEEWGSAAAEAAGQARQKAQDVARSAAHTAENFGEELTTLIWRYPMQGIILGLGGGYLCELIGRV